MYLMFADPRFIIRFK